MELTKMSLNFGTNQNYSGEVPLQCPYCGRAVELSVKTVDRRDFGGSENIVFYTFFVKCCSKFIFAAYHHTEDGYIFVSSYPEGEPEQLPASVEKISERFVKLYNDSSYAESKGMYELAGTGYRNSIEVLIKDFAINELNQPREEVVKKSLFESIELYLDHKDLVTSADVVRILGNDLTHYERKYEEYDLNTLKSYLNIFINMIHTKYLLLHPPVARK